MLEPDVTLQSAPTAQDAVSRYAAVRARSEALCKPLITEDYGVQAAEFASPPKWHLAHTSWFFEEMILSHVPGYKVFDAEFSFLFNSYYQAIGPRTPRGSRGLLSRPSVACVYAYRKHVDQHIERALNAGLTANLLERLALGLQHEEQHQELLLTDIKYALSCNPLHPVYLKHGSLVNDTLSVQRWVTLKQGLYTVGSNGKDGFTFDNEQGLHQVYLPGCRLASELVTNQEYMAFIADGGYSNPRWWLDEAWTWLQQNNAQQPLYWHKDQAGWAQFTLGGLLPLDPEAAVSHVNYYEANAFACWKGMRLPTEFEWEAACGLFNWGQRWEWTSSAYAAYPGFKVAQGALGEYNGKFMLNQMVLRGASVATSPGHSRATYRNFFHPDLGWQFTGIRLAI